MVRVRLGLAFKNGSTIVSSLKDRESEMNYSSKVIVFRKKQSINKKLNSIAIFFQAIKYDTFYKKVHCIFLYPFLRVPYLAVARTFEKIEEDSGRYEV